MSNTIRFLWVSDVVWTFLQSIRSHLLQDISRKSSMALVFCDNCLIFLWVLSILPAISIIFSLCFPVGCSYSPDIIPERNRYHWWLFSPFSRCFFHLWPPIWAQMGPYGPVYQFIWVLYEFCVFFTLFLHGFRWFYTWCLRLLTDFESSFYSYFITFLENYKDHLSSPPAHTFALYCTI